MLHTIVNILHKVIVTGGTGSFKRPVPRWAIAISRKTAFVKKKSTFETKTTSA